MFDPWANIIGGYSPNDGTIDFYTRVNLLVGPRSKVLDLGAGRGAWFEDDQNTFRKSTRLLRGKVAEVIAVDVDDGVLLNRTCDISLISKDGTIPVSSETIDVVIADYVLEHIAEVDQFFSEVDRVLKIGGFFCARTPHRFNYVSLIANAIPDSYHARLVGIAQKDRRAKDVFPTYYRLNTLSRLRAVFSNYEDHSYILRADPAYFFGNPGLFYLQSMFNRLAPSVISGNIFVFKRKQEVRKL